MQVGDDLYVYLSFYSYKSTSLSFYVLLMIFYVTVGLM